MPDTTRYVVTFDRIGRTHDIPPQPFTAADADDLAERIYRFATPRLMSRDVEVAVDLEAGTGWILCGFRNGGTFTVAAADTEPVS